MSLHDLPPGLPIPLDDGACTHLPSLRLPEVSLVSTSGERINPANIPGLAVIYVYPLSGRPGHALPDGWDATPGARGCTPEACGFRDHHADLTALGATVFGLSAQSTADQREFRDRLRLPFELLSDEQFRFTDAIRLPTFTVESRRLIKRLTLICRDATIARVFYPIFPPDRHAQEVAAALGTPPAAR